MLYKNSIVSIDPEKNMANYMGKLCFWLAENWKIFSFETTILNNFLVAVNNVCEVCHRKSSFHMDPMKNIAAMGNPCFWLAIPNDL